MTNDAVTGKLENFLLPGFYTLTGRPPRAGLTGDSLAEAGQVLHHLGDERERAGRGLGRVFLHQVEQGGRHDGWAHEAKEEGRTDEAVGQILSPSLRASRPPRGEHFL